MKKFKEVITALKEIVTDQFINKCEHCRKRLNKNECVERSVLVYYARVRREKYSCNSKHTDIYEKRLKITVVRISLLDAIVNISN